MYDSDPTESLLTEISTLVARRQSLRACGAGARELERNRVAISRLQWRLSHALIERYLPAAPEPRAA